MRVLLAIALYGMFTASFVYLVVTGHTVAAIVPALLAFGLKLRA